MLKKRIIPVLLWDGINLVKGKRFDHSRKVGTVIPAISVFNQRLVDELVLNDLGASKMGEEPDYFSIAEFSRECFVPLTVGGGVRNLTNIERLLKAGADKVSINSHSYREPQLITQAVQRFGAQCIVAAIDYRVIEDKAVCFSHCGKVQEPIELLSWIAQLCALGVGELIITNIDRDGCKTGYDLSWLERAVNAATVPVIAAGGCSSYEDMYLALSLGASAAAAASIFQFDDMTPKAAKHYLRARGVAVRVVD